MEIQGGKFLTFQLGKEIYGIPIKKAKEIIGVMTITHIPRTQGYIKGVINLRGKIVPVVDLRAKFGMKTKDYDDRTCIIIIEVSLSDSIRSVGIAVDTVSEVINIVKSDIEQSPQVDVQIEEGFLAGLGKMKDKVIIILNIDRILNSKEIVFIKKELANKNREAVG